MIYRIFGIMLFFLNNIYAKTVIIDMYIANESGAKVGSITAEDTKYGLLFTPNLTNLNSALTNGIHGFHIHENPSCADRGMAAGGHLDPKKTKHHFGPYNKKGHLGDLPVLSVSADGTSALPVLAPRLSVAKILGHSLMIHNGGDNYSDTPILGGGGSRMICGLISTKS
jgi:superoxide dismutase, Cu-Zn family